MNDEHDLETSIFRTFESLAGGREDLAVEERENWLREMLSPLMHLEKKFSDLYQSAGFVNPKDFTVFVSRLEVTLRASARKIASSASSSVNAEVTEEELPEFIFLEVLPIYMEYIWRGATEFMPHGFFESLDIYSTPEDTQQIFKARLETILSYKPDKPDPKDPIPYMFKLLLSFPFDNRKPEGIGLTVFDVGLCRFSKRENKELGLRGFILYMSALISHLLHVSHISHLPNVNPHIPHINSPFFSASSLKDPFIIYPLLTSQLVFDVVDLQSATGSWTYSKLLEACNTRYQQAESQAEKEKKGQAL